MTTINLTLPEFSLLFNNYCILKGKPNEFTVEGVNVIYEQIDEDFDFIWTIEEIWKEFTELSLVEFAKKFDVEPNEESIESYLYQEGSYPLGFTQDTVVFQDVLK